MHAYPLGNTNVVAVVLRPVFHVMLTWTMHAARLRETLGRVVGHEELTTAFGIPCVDNGRVVAASSHCGFSWSIG